MATRRQATRQELKLGDLLRMGATKIPAGFASKALAATKARLQKELNAGNAQRKQGARLFSRLQRTAAVSVKDPANKKALDQLLRWHKKLAAKKLAFPKVPGGFGGFVPGSISGTIVPPFDFADTIPTLLANVTNPTLSASANVSGRISGSAVTSQAPGFNGGSEFARVGIFFHPMTEGTLRISASPGYSFQWSTNSLNTTLVRSAGTMMLAIFGMNQSGRILSSAGELFEQWDENKSGQINFDFALDVQKSLSGSLNVTRSLIYLCFVSVHVHVIGMGWPGSLATAMASATVPSISFAFTPQLVATE